LIKKIILAVLVVASAAFLSILTPLVLRSYQRDAEDGKLLANHLYDSLLASIGRPIVISQCMASDTLLIEALKAEESIPESEMSDKLAAYLSSYRDKFGYIAGYIISAKTKKYYTPKGITKVINPQRDPYDSWFQLFVDSGVNLMLDTDRDEVFDYRWTVFINVRINDADGNLMGVCGVGVFMDELQELISKAESEYYLKISLIDKAGLVQVDTDTTNIENAYISEAISDKASDEEFTYTERSFGGFRLTRYMKDLEWYLVIQNIGRGKRTTGMTFFLVGIYIFLLGILFVNFYVGKNVQAYRFENADCNEDLLTGLPNRNYVKDSFGELGIFNTTRYKSLVMFDIDRFKVVNETRDGDSIIVDVVQKAKKIIGDKGIMFRWSGDEFVIFFEVRADEAEIKFKDFCADIKEALDISVSVGVVDIDLSQSIKMNYHRAVQMCYAVKAAGGNGVKRET